MAELDNQGRRLLGWLVDKLDDVEPGVPETYFSYSQVHEAMGMSVLGGNAGRSLQRQGLDSLAEWARATAKPAITGLIIRQEALDPGPGFFRLYGRDPMDYPWWTEQVRLAKQYDWSPNL